MTDRTRDDVVAEINKLFVELDQVSPEPFDLDQGWLVQDWVVVQRWVRLDQNGKVRGTFVVHPADLEMEDVYARMYLREGLDQAELGLASCVHDEDD